MSKDLVAVFNYLEKEKGIGREIVVSAIEDALLVAARKSVSADFVDVEVHVDPKNAKVTITVQKEVVDHITIPDQEILFEEAVELYPDCQIGDWVRIEVMPPDFGRIAAQTARQVISQKLRGAERDVIYEEYRHRIGEIVSGSVKRVVRGGTVIVDLGKVEGILPFRFYPKLEHYNQGDRVQALLYAVQDTENGGAEVVLSRSHPEFVQELFMLEVPEMKDGIVNIESIARDPGYRTKIALSTTDPKVDPVGACVGVRGTRVKNVIRELNNEKIDVLCFSSDIEQFLENAFAPVEIQKIKVQSDSEGCTKISIVVKDEDYPIVLGKKGINTRLVGTLLGVQIAVHRLSEYYEMLAKEQAERMSSEDETLDLPLQTLDGISSFIIEELCTHGYDTPRKLLAASLEELRKIPSVSVEMAKKILDSVSQKGGFG